MSFSSVYKTALSAFLLYAHMAYAVQSGTRYEERTLSSYCDAEIIKALERFMLEGDTLEVQTEVYLKLQEATGIQNPQFDLVRVDRAFNNYAHIVLYGQGSTPKLLSYAFDKDLNLKFARYNPLKSKVNIERYNPTLKGDRMCEAPKMKTYSYIYDQNEVPESKVEKKKFGFFKQKQTSHRDSSYTRLGLTRDLNPNTTLRVGPEWDSSPGAPSNMGAGVSLHIKKDGLFNFRKKR